MKRWACARRRWAKRPIDASQIRHKLRATPMEGVILKKNVTILAALVVVLVVLAALGGGWKWGGKVAQAHQPTMIAGWAWGDDGATFATAAAAAPTAAASQG